KAGYYTVLGNEKSILENGDSWGKTDYNFVYDSDWYDANDWQDKKTGQPFFAQIQLQGGKFRDAPVENPVNPADVDIPPYYPGDEVIRKDWAQYLNSVLYLDDQVKRITERLEMEGIADSTIIFLFTDHGISHLRGKQFLYDEGIQIPLIVHWPGFIDDGKRREELVSHIDIAAASLHLAGIPVPEVMQGRSFYGKNDEPREYIFAGRDRCDETVDVIRALRTPKFKYIRNYFPFKPYAQHNQYKDGKKIMQHMRSLYENGELKSETATYFYPLRAQEELYDLENDPHEMHNLASNPEYLNDLQNMQQLMLEAMQSTNDLGFIPEPITEILGKKYDNKYFISKQSDFFSLQNQCLETLSFDEENNLSALKTALKDKEPAVRFWAAYGLGNLNNLADDVLSELQEKLNDPSDAVKIAAARALCKAGLTEPALDILAENMSNQNLITGMYAALFTEDLDLELRQQIKPEIAAQQDNPYNFTRRVINRMLGNMEE
ncbi:MAG: sulfatase-like hydrolase/transferase, partial [Bacteroidota bacterium]